MNKRDFTLTDAVLTHQVDNDDVLVLGVDSTLKILGTAMTGCNVSCGGEITNSACLDLSTSLYGYIEAMPIDPLLGSYEKTYYGIKALLPSGVKVVACSPEGTEPIEIIR